MKRKIQNMLRNAYGFDEYSQILYYVAVIVFIISLFTKQTFLRVISLTLMIYSLYRTLSSKRSSRLRELMIFRKFKKNVKVRLKVITLNIQHRKENKYVICKSCQQILRLPKGKGSVVITCNRCRHQFETKS